VAVYLTTRCRGGVYSSILIRAAQILLNKKGLKNSELSLLLVEDEEMTEINTKWLSRPHTTNVISFPQQSLPIKDNEPLGDIVICVDTARREAHQAGQNLYQRLEALLVHGFAHLLGEDHELGEEEALRMKAVEDELLDILRKEKVMADLCVNVDHVATIRQARLGKEPDPIYAAVLVELAGADGVVVHLREDRRHIQDRDLRLLREIVKSRLTMEMAATQEMLKIACDVKPDIVTLVPERRQELTTEGGLDVIKFEKEITDAVKKLNDAGIPVSIFIDPDSAQIEAAARTKAQCIEIHTGRYADAHTEEEEDKEFDLIVECARLARDLGLRVHAGHGLDYRNTPRLVPVAEIEEFSIGHSIVSRAIFVGMEQAVREMLKIIKGC